MPQLKIIAACEKVIFDMNTRVPSLIGIFQGMNVPIADAPLPEKAVAPIKWAVFTLWQHTEAELNIEFTQQLRIIDPTGQIFAEGNAKLKITDLFDSQTKNSVEIFGLPVSNEGTLKILVWIDGIETSHNEYQFFIRHMRSQSHEQIKEDNAQPAS
jgi:hypothetical protein